MITEHDLQEAIAECEGQRNPSSTTCMKLAAFYTIRDKMFHVEQKEEPKTALKDQLSYSYSSGEETEFMQAVKSMDEKELIPVMDELMTTLKTVFPRLYDGVMRKLTE